MLRLILFLLAVLYGGQPVLAGEPARAFIPGELGREPGEVPPPPSERAFLTRALYFGALTPEGRAWAEVNHLTERPNFSHNLYQVFPPELFDRRPELFPELNGRRVRPAPRSINWNPELGTVESVAHAAEQARKFFDENPGAQSFALGTNDAVFFGDSAATRAYVYPPHYFRGRPVYTDLVFSFTNGVAAALEATHPDRYVGALAYYWSEFPSTFRIHPKVMPFLTADRSLWFDPAFRAQELAVMRVWSLSGAERIGLYDYVYGWGFLVPRIYLRTLAEHVRDARRMGFTDYFAEVGANWGLDGPQPWLLAQLLSDPEAEATVLLDEYYRRFFRAAGDFMREFFDGCEAVWAGQGGPVYWLKHYRNDSQAALYPPTVRARLRGALDRAARAAVGDPVAEARVAFVSEAFAVSECYVAMHEAREALAREALAVLAGRAGGEARLRALREADRMAREAFVAKLWFVQTQLPLAVRGPIPADFLRSDWGPVADWLLARRKRSVEVKPSPELLRDSGWRGPLRPAVVAAGLLYEPALPEGWRGYVEPWEGLVAELRTVSDGARVLRLENNKTSAFDQPLLAPEMVRGVFSARFSGEISATNHILFRVLWFNRDHAIMREHAAQIPPGSWRDQPFVLPVEKPDGASFVAVLLNVQHQQAGDWFEARDFSLRAD